MAVLEVGGMLTFLALSASIAYAAAQAFMHTDAGAWVLLVLLLGYVGGDLFTGFIHYFADNFGSETTPVLGRTFVFRFRQHHVEPRHICTLDFRELNGSHMLVSIPFLLPIALLPIAEGGWALALGLFGWSTLASGVFTAQVHRWSHDRQQPPLVRFLQRTRVILSPEHHALHHRRPHDVHFCITNGWLNGTLDRLRVWDHLTDVFVWMGVPQADDSVLGSARRQAREQAVLDDAIAAGE